MPKIKEIPGGWGEGGVFLTNYRVIFKGTPVDQFGEFVQQCSILM